VFVNLPQIPLEGLAIVSSNISGGNRSKTAKEAGDDALHADLLAFNIGAHILYQVSFRNHELCVLSESDRVFL
jgi:hypothetical protein